MNKFVDGEPVELLLVLKTVLNRLSVAVEVDRAAALLVLKENFGTFGWASFDADDVAAEPKLNFGAESDTFC